MNQTMILKAMREAEDKIAEAVNIIEENVNPDSMTFYELADMVSKETGIKRDCALDVLEMAFERIDLCTEDNDE